MRLIDADVIEKEIDKYVEKNREEQVVLNQICADAAEVVKWTIVWKSPTIEAEPVNHGKWTANCEAYSWKCSECGREMSTAHANYCPSCGSRMDLEG